MTEPTKSDDDLLLAPPDHQQQIEDMWQMLKMIGIASRHQAPAKRSKSKTTFIPLTILSGFLGAGKTTLLNKLLAGDHDQKLAVIVNDFGAVNIDALLIRSQDSDVISLANGCVCCSNSGQLGDTLNKLIASDPPPDAIILESSGVSDPRNTAHVALVNPAIQLDAIVTIVDSETVLERIQDSIFGHLVRRQVEAADIVVLNKSDLVTARQMFTLADWFAKHFPDVTCIKAENGFVPVGMLLGTRLSHYTTETAPLDQPHQSHVSFDTWSFSSNYPLNRDLLTDVLSRLPDTIARGKGILQLADDPSHQTIFQAVGRRWHFEKGDLWGEVTRHSNLVLIGAKGSINPDECNALFQRTELR